MNIGFSNASDIIKEITDELNRIPERLDSRKKSALNRMAKVVKNYVEENLPRSDQYSTATNYDGTPYTHMRSDVKTSVKDDKKGTIFAIIRGGKYTGYKWHMVDNGTSKMQGIHFTDRAMRQAERELEAIVDDLISEVTGDGD